MMMMMLVVVVVVVMVVMIVLLVVRWSETGVEQRAALLLRVADLLEARLDEFAEAESRDQGKPVWLARSLDIPRAVYNFRCFATALPHHVDTCVLRCLPHTSTLRLIITITIVVN